MINLNATGHRKEGQREREAERVRAHAHVCGISACPTDAFKYRIWSTLPAARRWDCASVIFSILHSARVVSRHFPRRTHSSLCISSASLPFRFHLALPPPPRLPFIYISRDLFLATLTAAAPPPPSRAAPSAFPRVSCRGEASAPKYVANG